MKNDDFTFNGFDQANTTPVPDVFFDMLLTHLNEAQLKVMLYIIRRTLGFKKTADAISLNQFRWGITTKDEKKLDGGCGLKNFTTISNALKSLEDMNCIESVKTFTAERDPATTVYRICFRGTTRNAVPTTANVVGVLQQTYDPTTANVVGVLRQTEPQETVIQDTDSQETVRQEEEALSLSPDVESDSATTNMTDLEKWKEDTDKRKTVSLRVATDAIGNTEGQDTEQVIIRPVLTLRTIGAKHESNTLPPWGNPGSDNSSSPDTKQQAARDTHRTAPATPEIRPGADQGVGERDLQTLIASQQTIPIPVAGEQQPAPQSTAPPPTASTSHAGSGGAPVASGQEPKPISKPRLRKTVIVKEQAGPPPFPPESQQWGTRTCVALFDFWRGAPKLDKGQIYHDSHCAKEMSKYYTRKQVVIARTAMSNDAYWKKRGGPDLSDVAHHIHEELNKLKMPVPEQPLGRPTLDEVQCVDPTWNVYRRPGLPQEWILWQGELCTPEEADERGYAGGGGLYIQTRYA